MAAEYSVCVRIDDKYRVISGIQKYGVGRFGSDSVHGEKLPTQDFGRSIEHALQRAAIFPL